MISPKFSVESKYEGISVVPRFLHFSTKVPSQKRPLVGQYDAVPWFLGGILSEKKVRRGRISMGSRILGYVRAITMVSTNNYSQIQDICSRPI